jgi:acetylornithine/N-succinyldiaminopimelate aminotransferase
MNTYGRYDVTFEKGSGCRVYDTEGNEYMDFLSGVAVNCLGHCHPSIVKAINEQSQKLIHVSNYFWNTKNLELADKLVENSDHHSVFFCNSGTEAVEGALKLARKYGRVKAGENKNILIHMENSFHGRSMGALTVTGRERYQKDFTPLIGGVKSAKLNDIDSLAAVINENTCGVILEPIQGEGGLNIADKEYLKKVRELCDKFDALLIYDEVQCGIGRCGSLYAYEKFGVIPDVICMAKALGGGFPIGAVMANEEAASAFVPGDHGTTYGGNPLACAASLAVLGELIEGGVISRVDEKSEYLKAKLEILKSKYPMIKEIKGMGLLLGISVSIDPKLVANACFKNKLLVAVAGEDVVRLLPPLNVENADMDIAIDILDKVLKELI